MSETNPAFYEGTWRWIPSYPGYQASNLGRIRSFWLTGNTKRMSSEPQKLLTENLRLRSRSRFARPTVRMTCPDGTKRGLEPGPLVLEAFVGPKTAGMVCCHDPDPDPCNNRIENLKWSSQSENMTDLSRHGYSNHQSLKIEDIPAIWSRILAGEKNGPIAYDYDVCVQAISRIRSGRNWLHVTRTLPGFDPDTMGSQDDRESVYPDPMYSQSEEEIWLPVPFNANYEGSTFGRIRSTMRGRLPVLRSLKPSKSGRYTTVSISRPGFKTATYSLHQIILTTFVGPPPPGMMGCHNDGDKNNNHVSNLRWGTRKSNSIDAWAHKAAMSAK